LTISVLSITAVDPDLSGDLDAALIEKINKRVDEKENTFKEAYAEDPEEALQALCKDIHTDMSEVERSEAQPEGLVSICSFLINGFALHL
jgi:hypothetical protein